MKLFFLIFITIMTNQVYAQNFATKLDLYENDFNNSEFASEHYDFQGQYPVNFSLVSARPVCPATSGRPRCLAYGSFITIKTTLSGCLDSLAYFNENTYMYDGKLYIEVDTMGFHNPASDSARCLKMPEVTKEIYVPFEQFEDIVIVNLNTAHK